jgi:hypothetical protein
LNWVNGQAPKYIAPGLFKKTKRKNIIVSKAMVHNKWISQVSPIQSMDELREFISLRERLTAVNRVEDVEDEIKWKWTPNGQYTTQSAYRIQFLGRRKKPALTPIWKAHAEPKCRNFVWILLQHKILTANNLENVGGRMSRDANYAVPRPKHLHIYASRVHAPRTFGCMLQHSLECRDYKQHHRKLLTAGGNGCVDPLTRSRNPLLTGLFCIFVEYLERTQ